MTEVAVRPTGLEGQMLQLCCVLLLSITTLQDSTIVRAVRVAAEREPAALARQNTYGVVIRRLARPWLEVSESPMAFATSMMGEMSGEAPSLTATVAVKAYAHGHEEPIRNTDISGITAASFKEIVAASASAAVFTAGASEAPVRLYRCSLRSGSWTWRGSPILSSSTQGLTSSHQCSSRMYPSSAQRARFPRCP